MADKVKADTTTTKTPTSTPTFVLEVGAPVFGEDAKVTFGGPATSTPTERCEKVSTDYDSAGATTQVQRGQLQTGDTLHGRGTCKGQDRGSRDKMSR